MRQPITEQHFKDENGKPDGGETSATGLSIQWQKGPLGRGAERKEPNGCFVETVIAAAKGRLEFYQSTEFHCGDNQNAIDHLNSALQALQHRTAEREARAVEGTHQK